MPRIANPEDRVQAEVVQLLRLHGGEVMIFAQGFRGHFDPVTKRVVPDRGGTRQTPGISDLEVFFPPHVARLDSILALYGFLGKFEVKTPDGMKLHDRMIAARWQDVPKSRLKDWVRAHAQQDYENHCRRCNVPYARGGVAEAVAWLVELGIQQ